jgi:hypothetical protein
VKLTQIAHQLGYTKAETRRFMFCGGGTDAAEAAAAGIEATTRVAWPVSAEESSGGWGGCGAAWAPSSRCGSS